MSPIELEETVGKTGCPRTADVDGLCGPWDVIRMLLQGDKAADAGHPEQTGAYQRLAAILAGASASVDGRRAADALEAIAAQARSISMSLREMNEAVQLFVTHGMSGSLPGLASPLARESVSGNTASAEV